ncbi:MAG TPA: hypothetical protein VHM66_02665 [Solirubrobacterales bacterium]|nr:hypothetical protein [Solirubrobacterales bacterium]
MVEDRVEDHVDSVAQEIGAALDPRPHVGQLALAVADGDDEGGVDEEQQLAEVAHLLGIHVVGGLDDD